MMREFALLRIGLLAGALLLGQNGLPGASGEAAAQPRKQQDIRAAIAAFDAVFRRSLAGFDVVERHSAPGGKRIVGRLEGALQAVKRSLDELDRLPEIGEADLDKHFEVQDAFETRLGAVELEGDFNDDGTVDAADYAVWRDGFGTDYSIDDFDKWKKNFGMSR